jgi:hypothetical protein
MQVNAALAGAEFQQIPAGAGWSRSWGRRGHIKRPGQHGVDERAGDCAGEFQAGRRDKQSARRGLGRAAARCPRRLPAAEPYIPGLGARRGKLGWPVREQISHHLAPPTQPGHVAESLGELIDQLRQQQACPEAEAKYKRRRNEAVTQSARRKCLPMKLGSSATQYRRDLRHEVAVDRSQSIVRNAVRVLAARRRRSS